MSGFLSGQPEGSGTSHLASNNPFRNRAVSPSLPSPTSPFDDPTPRSTSRNPFLDPGNSNSSYSNTHHHTESNPTPQRELLIQLDMAPKAHAPSHSQSSISDIFNDLKVDDRTMSTSSNAPTRGRGPSDAGRSQPLGTSSGQSSSRSRGGGMPPPRAKNIPPRQSPPDHHRPSRSQEEANKSRQMSVGQLPSADAGRSGISAETRRQHHSERPRRNSESSIAGDKSSLRAERSIRDLRRREHDGRGKSSSRTPAQRRNDIIDQMDASSIFGTVFHHDGPFDALNPHRNRKGSRRAPMQAFPKGSLNNVIGGSGPLNQRPDHKTFMGQNDEEAFKDYATSKGEIERPTIQTPVFDPLQRGSILHGDQTLGLGTSTFLEGTPAARTTIQRQDAERVQDVYEGGSLQRKKSLAQRFRSINRGPRDGVPARAFSTDGAPITSRGALGPSNESSAFDEFDSRKGEDVITVRRKGSAAPTSPSSPSRSYPLERRSTTDGNDQGETSGLRNEEAQQPRSGLLARVKSLKGNRRPAPPPPMKDS